MKRLTAKRVNGIKKGYWSSAKKEELVQALGKYEDTGYSPEEILRVSKSTVTRFDLFKGMGSDMAAQMILDLAKRVDNRETLRDYISEAVSEEELRRIDAAAKKDGIQPLSFSLRAADGGIKLRESPDYFTDHDFERKQLEELLLKIVERESDDAATPTGLVGVACIARTLMDLWKS